MKRRLFFYLAFLATLALLGWCLFIKPKPEAHQPEQTPSQGSPVRLPETNQAASTAPPPLPQPGKSKTTEQLKKEYTSLNHRPIEFYGKAMDQFGNPVPYADVWCTVIIRTPLQEGVAKKMTKTGADGSFQFTGLSGESIGVAVSKQGYLRESERTANSSFVYSLMYKTVHKPDPNNPVIFKMWKLAGPEPMIEGQKFFKVRPNGPEYTIDLVTGKKIEGRSNQGDFVIQIHRPEAVVPHSQYDWSFEVQAVDGGILEITDSFPYLAPESGYKPSHLEVIDATQTGWSPNTGKLFYLKSRGGRIYARVQLDVYSKYPDGSALDVKYYANPSGSRNLEFDSEKRLTKDEIAKLGFGTTTNGQSQ